MSNTQEIVIEIDADGQCFAVWDDNHVFHTLGDISVTRLSDVEYNNDLGGWQVIFRNGVVLPVVFARRQDALAAEIEYVNAHFQEFRRWIS